MRQQWLEFLQMKQRCQMTCIFAPDHTDTKGDEEADQLAGSVNIKEEIAMDRQILSVQ